MAASELVLNLTLFPLGPRETFESKVGTLWHFALQISAGYSAEPAAENTPALTKAKRAAWARASLPWHLCDANAPLTIRWWVQPASGAPIAGTATGQQAARLPDLDLRTPLEKALPDFVDADVDPTKPKEDRQPDRIFNAAAAEADDMKLLVPALVPAIGGVVPNIASGEFCCVWYFSLPLDAALVKLLESDGTYIIAAPDSVCDDRAVILQTGAPQTFAVSSLQPGADAGMTIHYVETSPGTVDTLIGQTRGILSLGLIPPPADDKPEYIRRRNEPLHTYILSTHDSRLDSLAEVEVRLLQLLSPNAMAAALSPDVVLAAGLTRIRVSTESYDEVLDARQFIQAATAVAQHYQATWDRDASTILISGWLKEVLKKRAEEFHQELRSHVVKHAETEWRKWLPEIVRKAAAHLPPDTTWDLKKLHPLGEALMDSELPAGAAKVGPMLPGEGIDIRLGAQPRLRHAQDLQDTGMDSEFIRIGEFGVLVRRAMTPQELDAKPWAVATGCIVVHDEKGELTGDRYWGSNIDFDGQPPQAETIPHSRQAIVRGLQNRFVNDLASADITYLGAPLIAASPADHLNEYEALNEYIDDQGKRKVPLIPLLPVSYQAAGPVSGANIQPPVLNAGNCLVPPLRYGDAYQFLGFVIDRAGGISPELATNGSPAIASHFDWNALKQLRVPLMDPITGHERFERIVFLRRIPVGDVNITPTAAVDAKPAWPSLPSDVRLRGREWMQQRFGVEEGAPAVLLGGQPAQGFLPGCASQVKFHFSAPSLDEMTFSRWRMPALNAGNPAAELAQLNEEIAAIHTRREERGDEPQWDAKGMEPMLPLDPAVTAIAVRIFHGRLDGSVEETVETFPPTRQAIQIDFEAGTDRVLQPGEFFVFEFASLVSPADFSRFEQLAMDDLVQSERWVTDQGVEWVAFQPSRVLVEAATTALPDPAALYDALRVAATPTGAIDVVLESDVAALPALRFIERYELARERWLWRNRPLLDPHNPTAFQSEPPRDLSKPTKADASEPVLRFDAVAAMDHGFVSRGKVGAPLPRTAGGEPLPKPLLHQDDRDGLTHADYLRFGCTFFSRYAGVLATEAVTAAATHAPEALRALEPLRLWRRITVPFRGEMANLKAPKVLALLPLTRTPPVLQPFGTSKDATPFLLVLDEIWFREYGIGERLQAEVVLETREIGEEFDKPRPYRAGPLPDHYRVDGSAQPFGHSTDLLQADPAKREVLPVLGPFGYSLDRSGNEAGANATAFVIYPPSKVKAQFAVFVRFRRALHAADGQMLDRGEGPPGDTYPLYTFRDAARLVQSGPQPPDRVPPILKIESNRNVRLENLNLELSPVATLDADVAAQYRYVAIFGKTIADSGRGLNLMLPKYACWLHAGGKSAAMIEGSEPQHRIPPGTYEGRIVEILLNGRYAGKSPLEDTCKSLHQLLDAMFTQEATKHRVDAPGAIRRVSDSFTLVLE